MGQKKEENEKENSMKESQGQFESGETREQPRENQNDLKKGKTSESSDKDKKGGEDSCCK